MSDKQSLLYLKLDAATGTVSLTHAMQAQTLTLKKVLVTWGSVANSATAGTLVNVELDFFNHNSINSNRSSFEDTIPIMNDITKRVTLYTLDMPISTEGAVKQEFSYRIFTSAGVAVANLTSLDLIFSYSEGAIL